MASLSSAGGEGDVDIGEGDDGVDLGEGGVDVGENDADLTEICRQNTHPSLIKWSN